MPWYWWSFKTLDDFLDGGDSKRVERCRSKRTASSCSISSRLVSNGSERVRLEEQQIGTDNVNKQKRPSL